MQTQNKSDFLTSLNIEIEFSRKKYKEKKAILLTNGTLVSRDEEYSVFVFSLMDERHIPNSDAKIIINQERYDAAVNYCYGRTVEVSIVGSFDDKIPSAKLEIESWRLLKQLSELFSETILNPSAVVSALDKLHSEQPKELDSLQCGQEKAIAESISLEKLITVIWGPPGTGKTYTIGRLTTQLLLKGKRVLVVSLSNVSVDGAAMSVLRCAEKETTVEGKVFRYGYVYDSEVLSHPFLSSHNYVMNKNMDDMSALSSINEKLREKKTTAQYNQLLSERERLLQRIKSAETGAVNKANIVITTVAKAFSDTVIYKSNWDYIIFDESSMSTIPQIYVMAQIAKSKMIIVGDFRQLSPISESNQRSLQQDIFEYLNIFNPGDGKVYRHPNLIVLNIQHRMHPDICRYVSSTYYDGVLESAEETKNINSRIYHSWPFEGHALSLIDCSDLNPFVIQHNESRINIISAIVSANLAIEIKHRSPEVSIGIITPYSQQAFLINTLLMDCKGSEGIVCATVHQFQGEEKDVIIFDSVESPTGNVQTELGKMFTSEGADRLINVAITRAKGRFILVSNAKFFSDQGIMLKGKILGLIKTTRDECSISLASEIANLFLESTNSTLGIVKNMYKYDYFNEACSSSSSSIECFIPYKCSVNSSSFGLIDFSHVKDYVSIAIYSDEQGKGWGLVSNSIKLQNVRVQGPVVCSIIDDNTIWIGVPDYEFRDGRTGVKNGYFVSGENSSSALRSILKVDETRADMIEKNKNGNSDTLFKAFIAKSQQCDNCYQYSMIVRWSSKSRKYYCHCKNCKNSSEISKELILKYLDANNIICPECGSKLKYHVTSQQLICVEKDDHIFDFGDLVAEKNYKSIVDGSDSKKPQMETTQLVINPDGSISLF